MAYRMISDSSILFVERVFSTPPDRQDLFPMSAAGHKLDEIKIEFIKQSRFELPAAKQIETFREIPELSHKDIAGQWNHCTEYQLKGRLYLKISRCTIPVSNG